MKSIYREHPKWLWYDYGKPLTAVVVTALIVWLIGLVGYNFALDNASHRCETFGQQTNYVTEYRNLSWGNWECFANVNGQWIPDQQLRIVGAND